MVARVRARKLWLVGVLGLTLVLAVGLTAATMQSTARAQPAGSAVQSQSSGGWHIQTVDSDGDAGRHTSLALDADDRPHISYTDWAIYHLKYARWDGSAWITQTVDSIGEIGGDVSLALDAEGRPHIGYSDRASNDLRYARWTGTVWRSPRPWIAPAIWGATRRWPWIRPTTLT